MNSLDGRVHFRIRKSGTWLTPFNPQSAGPTKYRNLGVGYAPHQDMFVLAYVDVCDVNFAGTGCNRTPDIPENQMIFVRTIQAWNGGGGCTQALSTVGHVLAVGDVSCDHVGPNDPTQCVIPVSTTTTDGPELRFIEGTIIPHDGSICFVRNQTPMTPLTLTGTVSLGGLSSAMDSVADFGALMAGYVPGFPDENPSTSNYARLFTMDRDLSGKLDGQIDNSKTLNTDYWPLHVGSLTRDNMGVDEIQWFAITY